MDRRHYLSLLSGGLSFAAGCIDLPLPLGEDRPAPGSVEFWNRTSERAELQLQGWQIEADETPTATPTTTPDTTTSVTADPEQTAIKSSVFPEGNWRLYARSASHESTATYSIRDLDTVGIALYPDKLTIAIYGYED